MYGRTWVVDYSLSYFENTELRMVLDGDFEIVNHKVGADGKMLYRVRWGGSHTTVHYYSWVPKTRFDGNPKMLDDYIADPCTVDI